MNLGKDGRKLSYFQSSQWMKKIYKNRKYDSMPRGEKNKNAKATASWVLWLRSLPGPISRERMKRITAAVNLSQGYGYHLRNPNMKKWAHLGFSIDLALDACIRKGWIKKLPNNEFTMTEKGIKYVEGMPYLKNHDKRN